MSNRPQNLVGPLPSQGGQGKRDPLIASIQEEVSLERFRLPGAADPLPDKIGPQHCPHCQRYPSSTRKEGYLCHFCKHFLSHEQNRIFVKAAMGVCTGSCNSKISDQDLLNDYDMCDSCAETQKNSLKEMIGDILAFEIKHGTFIPPQREYVGRTCAEMIAVGRCANIKCAKSMMLHDRYVRGSIKPGERFVFCAECRPAISRLVNIHVASRKTQEPMTPQVCPPNKPLHPLLDRWQFMFSFGNVDRENGDDSNIYYASSQDKEPVEPISEEWLAREIPNMMKRGSPPPMHVLRRLGGQGRRLDTFLNKVSKEEWRRNRRISDKATDSPVDTFTSQMDQVKQAFLQVKLSPENVAGRAGEHNPPKSSADPRRPRTSGLRVQLEGLLREVQAQNSEAEAPRPEQDAEPKSPRGDQDAEQKTPRGDQDAELGTPPLTRDAESNTPPDRHWTTQPKTPPNPHLRLRHQVRKPEAPQDLDPACL